MSYEIVITVNEETDETRRVKLIRRGECNRCGDCCRCEEFKIPWLWDGEKCKYLEGNTCTVWGTPELPWYCKTWPRGTEAIIKEKLQKGERLDFKPLLPNCPFFFERAPEG